MTASWVTVTLNRLKRFRGRTKSPITAAVNDTISLCCKLFASLQLALSLFSRAIGGPETIARIKAARPLCVDHATGTQPLVEHSLYVAGRENIRPKPVYLLPTLSYYLRVTWDLS